jgi:DNA-binding transcriptional MerR regulator
VVTQRSYLSIGDVLSLLREEFPDVTISKIRFLESQGLVDPERSPSGYRKFYDHDVARLRWVLRAQRDQFLPLKVIRDRLAAAGNGVPPDDEWPEAEAHGETHLTGNSAEVGARGAHARDDRGGNSRPQVSLSTSSRASDEASDVHAPESAVVVEQMPVEAERPGAEAAPTRHVAASQEARRATPAAPRAGERRGSPAASAPEAAGGALPSAVSDRGGVLSPSLSGVSLTLAELCAATGLATHTVAALEGLGLITPIAVAGGAFYDEEALMVGKLAAEFAHFGIEPRHLRLYRNAVDREMGLVEQVVTPLLRQRNPEARQRAVETASELAKLGENLRASLVRTELRRQLGG